MTNAEMIYEVRLGYDSFYSSVAPSIIDEEIASVLNKAQDQFINISIRNGETESLANILNTTSMLLISGGDHVANIFSTSGLPDNYWTYASASVNIIKNTIPNTGLFYTMIGNTTSWIKCDLVDDQSELTSLINGNNNALFYLRGPKLFILNSKIQVILDGASTLVGGDNLNLTFVKKRADITTSGSTCEILDMYHRNIVDLALEIIRQYIEGPKQQQQ